MESLRSQSVDLPFISGAIGAAFCAALNQLATDPHPMTMIIKKVRGVDGFAFVLSITGDDDGK